MGWLVRVVKTLSNEIGQYRGVARDSAQEFAVHVPCAGESEEVEAWPRAALPAHRVRPRRFLGQEGGRETEAGCAHHRVDVVERRSVDEGHAAAVASSDGRAHVDLP